jgi:hypothetical protein
VPQKAKASTKKKAKPKQQPKAVATVATAHPLYIDAQALVTMQEPEPDCPVHVLAGYVRELWALDRRNNKLQKLIRYKIGAAMDDRFEAGEYEGKWVDFVEQHFDIPYRSAQRYRLFAKHVPISELGTDTCFWQLYAKYVPSDDKDVDSPEEDNDNDKKDDDDDDDDNGDKPRRLLNEKTIPGHLERIHVAVGNLASELKTDFRPDPLIDDKQALACLESAEQTLDCIDEDSYRVRDFVAKLKLKLTQQMAKKAKRAK